MSFYEPPTENLAIFDSSVFTANDVPLTIATGSKYFLKFPYAQNTENFQDINSVGTATFTGADTHQTHIDNTQVHILDTATNDETFLDHNSLYMVQPSTNHQASFEPTNANWQNPNNIISVGHVLYQSGLSGFEAFDLANGDNVVITPQSVAITDGAGSDVTYYPSGLTSNGTYTCNATTFELTGLVNLNGATTCNNKFNSSSVIGLNREVNTSYFRFNNTTNNSVFPVSVGSMSVTDATMNINNDYPSGNINFNSKISGVVTQLMNVAPTGITANRSLTLSSGNSLNLSGQGIINQPGISPTDPNFNTTQNSFRRTNITMDCSSSTLGVNVGNNIPLLEVYDNNPTNSGKGFFCIPNSKMGALNPVVRLGDSSIMGRSPQSANAMTMSIWAAQRCGMRVASVDTNNVNLSLECGSNYFTMSYNASVPEYINTFNGNLRWLDIVGGTTYTNIGMNAGATIPGMIYDCSLNAGSHTFITQNNLGAKNTPFAISPVSTNVFNNLAIRNSTTNSNQLQIATDAAQNTTIKAMSTTNSTVADINFLCDSVSAGGAVTSNAVLNLTPTYVETIRPLQLTYTTYPNSLSQLGYTPTITSAGSFLIGTSASVQTLGNFTVPLAGTYAISVNVWGSPASGTATLSEMSFAIDGTTASFPSLTVPTKFTPSVINEFNTTLTSAQTFSRQLRLNIQNTSSQIYYVSVRMTWTGGMNINVGFNYSYTRIG